jgi:hypothetical protein
MGPPRRIPPAPAARYGYNRHVKSTVWLALAGLLALGGCNRGAQTKEAVQAAVIDYLAKRGTLDISRMRIEVVSVTFRQNEADATVSFQPKDSSDAGAGMTMAYTLERKGGGWAVKPRPGGMAGGHGAGMQVPEGAPPGHPPVGGAAAPAEAPK